VTTPPHGPAASRGSGGNRPVAIALVAALAIALLAVDGCGGVSPAGSSSAASATAPAASVTTVSPAPTPSPVGSPATAQAILDTARQTYGAPGALAVIRHGDERIFLVSGAADTAGTPISETTRFRIASITKPIVAALVLDAVARGEIGLDDVVGDLLPGVLRPEPPVTVRQLLDHTSGIFDESNGIATQAEIEADIAKLADPALRDEADATLRQVLAGKRAIASDRVLIGLSETHDRLFAPGTQYAYSNINYQVAAMLLERRTGTSLADLLQARLVEPLGLQRVSIAPPDTASPEFRGYGTSTADGSLVDMTDGLGWFGNGGNGGIISTPDDLLTAMQAIVGGRYVPAGLTKAMLTLGQGSYGLGIGGYPFACGTLYGHQGGVNGTASIAAASTDGKDGVVVAFNLRSAGDPDLVGLAEDLLCSSR
jgi:D-alanyl-D-alanine carboxypeptidase